jgi:flagellar basal body rod protein FlgB
MQSGQPTDQVAFQPFTQQQTVQANGNGVNPEQESANLAENGLLFQQLAQVAAQRESILKSAMGVA